ncbi:hypothetical protein CI238_02674, partial [Colletotrichum incanum]
LWPDPGGCLLPLAYTMAWILIHLPVTVLRIRRWGKVRTLSRLLNHSVMQNSSRPNQVILWIPLAIVLDIGAMVLLVFLVIEENGVAILWIAFRESILRPFIDERVDAIPAHKEGGSSTTKDKINPVPVPSCRSLIGQAWLTVLAVILLVVLLPLQLIGLISAAKGRSLEGLKAVWCSSMFQSAECVLINCNMPPYIGEEQYHWLTATVTALSIRDVFEVFDAAILVMIGNKTRWWRARMKKPWFIMLTGNTVLLCILTVDVIGSSRLPNSVSRVIWVFKYEQSTYSSVVC